MAGLVYLLCAGTALGCSVLLLRKYRQTGAPLLWWSGLFFAGLLLDNFFLFVDRILLPHMDLSLYRAWTGLVTVSFLLFGLIWKTK